MASDTGSSAVSQVTAVRFFPVIWAYLLIIFNYGLPGLIAKQSECFVAV